jgi:DNA-binding NarL/FixJ family response regulator
MAPARLLPELTEDESRLLPLLATQLSFGDISRLLELPRDEIAATAQSIFRKLGIESQAGAEG